MQRIALADGSSRLLCRVAARFGRTSLLLERSFDGRELDALVAGLTSTLADR